jgi:hypothetical protein
MALKKVIEIDVDVLNAQGGIDAFVGSLKETEQQSVSLKTELRKLKEQLAQLPEGTAEYDKIAKRAGEVSDQIGDINTKVKNLGSDTKGIDAVVQGAQTLSGAFAVASSASALLGDNNEDLQKTMLKVESAIALTVGIQSIANALQKESALVLGLQSTATAVQTGLQTAYTLAVGGTTGALKLLRLALISTGIGAIVVLIGSLIGYLASLEDNTESVTEAQDRFNKSLDRSNQLLKDNIKNIDAQSKNAVLRAKILGKSEEDIFKVEQEYSDKKLKALGNEYDRKYALANKFRKDAKKVFQEGSEEEIKIAKDTQSRLDKELLDAKDAYYSERQNKQTNALNRELDIANQNRDAEKKANEDAIKNKEIADEKEQKRLLAIRKKELEEINAQAKIIEDNIKKNAEEKLKNDADIKRKADEILKQIDIELAPEETPTQKLKREYEERLQILNEAGASTLSLEAKYVTDSLSLENKLAEDKKELRDKELADEKALQAQKLNTLGVSFGKVSELLGKNSKAGKAFAVSQALINTYQGITAELATKTATPFEFGVKLVNIASVVGIGFKAVKDILKTPEMSLGGGGASAPSGGGAGSSAPTFNVVGNAGVNQIATTLGKEQPPVQAFVVSKQMTNQQEMDRNIVKNATL